MTTTPPVEEAHPGEVVVSTQLPLTGSKTTGPLTLAVGLFLSGLVAIGLASRRRLAAAHARGTHRSIPLSESLGALLNGSAGRRTK